MRLINRRRLASYLTKAADPKCWLLPRWWQFWLKRLGTPLMTLPWAQSALLSW